jgi:hypothetical protein
MSAATQQRLIILLDTRLPLETMILNRLQRLPQSRRKDWLRSLLVTGFSAECQALKSQALPKHSSGMNHDSQRSEYWRMRASSNERRTVQADASPEADAWRRAEKTQICCSTNHTKPFAHLKSVIGQ